MPWPSREPPGISLKELSDRCSEILAKKTIHPDMLKRLALKMASLPSDEEVEARRLRRQAYDRNYQRERKKDAKRSS